MIRDGKRDSLDLISGLTRCDISPAASDRIRTRCHAALAPATTVVRRPAGGRRMGRSATIAASVGIGASIVFLVEVLRLALQLVA